METLTPEMLALGLFWYIVFLLSTTCHEAAHALAGKLGGDPTAFHGGQVTLNPLPHIRREPFGMVLVPIISYVTGGWMMGWASAPYDPYWAMRHPRRAAVMSLAGPAANLLLVATGAAVIRLGMLAGVFQPPRHIRFTQIVEAAQTGPADGLATFLSILFCLNVLLAVFNLIPLPPLDGYSALALFGGDSWARRLEEWRMTMGGFAIIGMLVAWQLMSRIFWPVLIFFLRLLYIGV